MQPLCCTPDDLRASIEIDAILNFSDLTEPAISEVFALAPFGCGNPSPVFAVRNAELAGPPALFLKTSSLSLRSEATAAHIMASSWNLAAENG